MDSYDVKCPYYANDYLAFQAFRIFSIPLDSREEKVRTLLSGSPEMTMLVATFDRARKDIGENVIFG